ncbi:MAG: histidine phosphatase family protein [Bacteroidota bacterium]
MSMLYLIRHSYAENSTNIRDKDRALTAEGLNTVRSLGRHLMKTSFNPSVILCSTALRTRETAINLAEELEIKEKNIIFKDTIYNASVRELLRELNTIKKSNDTEEVGMIGHNPSITYLAEYLTGESIGNMAPSSLVTILFKNQSWSEISQGSGSLISYFHPSQLNV